MATHGYSRVLTGTPRGTYYRAAQAPIYKPPHLRRDCRRRSAAQVQVAHFFWAFLKLRPPPSASPSACADDDAERFDLAFAVPSGAAGHLAAGCIARCVCLCANLCACASVYVCVSECVRV